MRWEGTARRPRLIVSEGDWVWRAVQGALDIVFDLPPDCGYVDCMVEEFRFRFLGEMMLLIHTGVLESLLKK